MVWQPAILTKTVTEKISRDGNRSKSPFLADVHSKPVISSYPNWKQTGFIKISFEFQLTYTS